MSKISTPSSFSMRRRIFSPQRSEPMTPLRRWILSRRPRSLISSASSSAYELVAPSTVDLRSCIICSCFSVLPGPIGMAIAPRRSAPSWKPMPAVHRP